MSLRSLWILAIAGKLGWIAMGLVVVRVLWPALFGDFAGVAGVAGGLFTTHLFWGLLLFAGGLAAYFSRYPGLIEPEGRPYLAALAAFICAGGLGIAVGSPTLAAGAVLLLAAVAWLWLRRCDRLNREKRIGRTVTPVIVHESQDRIRAVLGGRHVI
ncbi:MAG: hypothetical protein ACT4SY_09280 [Hyphomicrobiales bacterium]